MANESFVKADHCWHQCDQIGRFSELLGNKLAYKSSPNILLTLCAV